MDARKYFFVFFFDSPEKTPLNRSLCCAYYKKHMAFDIICKGLEISRKETMKREAAGQDQSAINADPINVRIGDLIPFAGKHASEITVPLPANHAKTHEEQNDFAKNISENYSKYADTFMTARRDFMSYVKDPHADSITTDNCF